MFVNCDQHLYFAATPSNVLHPNITSNGLAAGLTTTFVTVVVLMDRMNGFHHVVGV